MSRAGKLLECSRTGAGLASLWYGSRASAACDAGPCPGGVAAGLFSLGGVRGCALVTRGRLQGGVQGASEGDAVAYFLALDASEKEEKHRQSG